MFFFLFIKKIIKKFLSFKTCNVQFTTVAHDLDLCLFADKDQKIRIKSKSRNKILNDENKILHRKKKLINKVHTHLNLLLFFYFIYLL